jgi:hypothetical protein
MTAADGVRTAQGRAPHIPHLTAIITTDRTAIMTTTARGMIGDPER